MKKRGNHENRAGKGRQNETKPAEDKKNEKNAEQEIALNDDTHNQGFSEWLRSSDGIEMMRLFVIANSVLVFVTMGWPKMQEAIAVVKDYFYEEE
ncbi:uncharacterized protein LOC128877000 [Hylaeus volcanicus]|uniref:uncharacterized protein LOC128877000 n=1 Tax=Hylaeus volcanicus TaxID=313075 RepID=UPI0023B7E1D9|nr:uncharacterized protein LOC128877000 [Hylaeus volcanicus]